MAPKQRTVICVGDLHGHISKLNNLWLNLQSALSPSDFSSALVIFLGDYCDRGPQTRKVIDFLISLPEKHPDQTHVFIAGNHDFAFAGFLGLLDGSHLKDTWNEFEQSEEREGWYSGKGFDDMHVQARRWAGKISDRCDSWNGVVYNGSIYDAATTFESYGVPHGSSDLMEAVPVSHKKFLTDMVWVHEEYSGKGFDDMHVQARRWAGKISDRCDSWNGVVYNGSIYDAAATFESYGVPHGSSDLMEAVPVSHKKFLTDMVWVHEEDDICIETEEGLKQCKLIAVHAGLEKVKNVNEQLKLLRAKDTSISKIQPLSGRRNVWDIPPELDDGQTVIVSGHHGKLHIDGLRLIIDESGGYSDMPLAAIVLPSKKIIRDTDDFSKKIIRESHGFSQRDGPGCSEPNL